MSILVDQAFRVLRRIRAKIYNIFALGRNAAGEKLKVLRSKIPLIPIRIHKEFSSLPTASLTNQRNTSAIQNATAMIFTQATNIQGQPPTSYANLSPILKKRSKSSGGSRARGRGP